MSQKILRTMQDDLKEIKNIKMGKGLFKKTVPKKEETKEEPAKQPSPAPMNASAAPKIKTIAPQVPATPAKENFSDIKSNLEQKGFNVSISPLSKGKTPIVSEKKKEDASKDFFAKLQEKIAKKKQDLQKEEPVRPAEIRKELPKAMPVVPAPVVSKPVEKPKVDPEELKRQQVKNEILTEIRSEVQKEKDKLRSDILAQIKQQEESRKAEILKAQEELKKQETLRAEEAKKAQEAIKAQEEKVSGMLKEVTDSLSKEEAEMEESKKAMVEEMRTKIIEEESKSREQILSEINRQEELRKAEIQKAQDELKKQEELRVQEIRMSQEALKAEDSKRAQEAKDLNEAIRKQEAEINELVKQLSHAPSKEDLIEAMRVKILEEEKHNREDILRQMKIQEAELSGFIKEISSNLQERSAREEEFQESVLDKVQEGDKRTEGTILARIQEEEKRTKDAILSTIQAGDQETKDAILSTIQEEDRKTKDTILARIQVGDQETKDSIMAEVKAQEGDREQEVNALRAEIQDKDAQISNLLKGIAASLEEESDRSEAKEKLIEEMRTKIAELETEKGEKEDQIKKIRSIMGVKPEEQEEKPDLEKEIRETEERLEREAEEKTRQEEARLEEEKKLKQEEETRLEEENKLRQEEEAKREAEARQEAEEKLRQEKEEKARKEEIARIAREAEERQAAEEERLRQEEEEQKRQAEEEARLEEEEKKRQQEEEENRIQEAIKKAAEEERLRQEEEDKQKSERRIAEEALGMTQDPSPAEEKADTDKEEIKPDEEPPAQAPEEETIEPDQPEEEKTEETPEEERKATHEDFWNALRKKRTEPEKKESREAQTNSPEDEDAAQEKEERNPQDEEMKTLIQKISRSMDAPVNAATAPEELVKPDKDKELKDLLSRMSKNIQKEEQEKETRDSESPVQQSESPAQQNPTRILNPEDDPRSFRPSPAAMAQAGTTYWEKLHDTMKESAISPAQRIMGGTSIAASPYDNPDAGTGSEKNVPPDNSELVMPNEVRTAQQRIQERRQTAYPSYMNPENRLIDGKQEFYSTVHKTIKPKMQIESLEGLDTILKDEEMDISEEEEKKRLKQNIVSKYKIKLFSIPWARIIIIGTLFLALIAGTLMVVLPKFKTQKQELAPVTVGSSITDIDRKITAEAFAKQSQVSSMNFFDANIDPWKSFNNGTIIRLNIDYDNQNLMLSREEALKTVLGENNAENMPENFLNAVSSEYNILVFKGNGSMRLGLVFKYNSSKQDEFKDILTSWENTNTKSKKMYSVMKNLFVNSRIIEEDGAAFQPAMYNGTELRFQNLPDSDTSMDYFLYEGYVVFTSSKDHTFQMIDILRS